MPETLTFIGGFGFNQHPCSGIFNLGVPVNFIDLNLFPAYFKLQDMADYVQEQLMQNSTQRIVAYSGGGLVAILAGLKYPKLIRQIILINSSPCFLAAGAWPGIKPADLARLKSRLLRLGLPEFMHYFTALTAYPEHIKYGKENNFISHWSLNSDSLLNLLDIIATTDLRAELPRLKADIHFIYSDTDILVPSNNSLKKYHLLPNSTHLNLNQAALVPIMKDILCHKI